MRILIIVSIALSALLTISGAFAQDSNKRPETKLEAVGKFIVKGDTDNNLIATGELFAGAAGFVIGANIWMENAGVGDIYKTETVKTSKSIKALTLLGTAMLVDGFLRGTRFDDYLPEDLSNDLKFINNSARGDKKSNLNNSDKIKSDRAVAQQ